MTDSTTCPTCGTTRITFDPPIYFEANEACGKEVEIHITTVHETMVINETCVNIKDHEGRHYALIEELFYYE